MLDVEVLRKSPAEVRANLERRRDAQVLARFDEFVALDRSWRDALQKVQELRAERNRLGEAIGAAKRSGKAPNPGLVDRSKALPQQLASLDDEMKRLAEQRDALAKRLPNLLHESVPEGKDSGENVEERRWPAGEPKEKGFEVQAHGELVERLGLADFQRATKASGAGFVYLLGDLARLDFALQLFALDVLRERGFTIVQVPLMLRREPYEGVTDLSDFESVMYKIQGEELYLIATSEHAIGAMHLDEVLDEAKLPLRYAGVSPCFRREIGAHGVDTRGLFRMHQFNKVEQFVFCAPEHSWAIHEEILENALHIFRSLEVPHRVVNVCTGDIGTVAAKKYDIEAWSPRQRKWTEVVSCSNCTDYQARRLRIRAGKVGGEKRAAHTLNSTAVATSRALVAILENHQQADGSVLIPKVLRPYLGGLERLGAPRPTP